MSHLFCAPSHGLVVNPDFFFGGGGISFIIIGAFWTKLSFGNLLNGSTQELHILYIVAFRVYLRGEIFLFLIIILTYKYTNYMTTLVFKSLELLFIFFKNLYSRFQCLSEIILCIFD